MMSWTFSFQDDVAPNLVNALVAVLAAKHVREISPAKITRNSHAQARTSSRTRCRRI